MDGWLVKGNPRHMPLTPKQLLPVNIVMIWTPSLFISCLLKPASCAFHLLHWAWRFQEATKNNYDVSLNFQRQKHGWHIQASAHETRDDGWQPLRHYAWNPTESPEFEVTHLHCDSRQERGFPPYNTHVRSQYWKSVAVHTVSTLQKQAAQVFPTDGKNLYRIKLKSVQRGKLKLIRALQLALEAWESRERGLDRERDWGRVCHWVGRRWDQKSAISERLLRSGSANPRRQKLTFYMEHMFPWLTPLTDQFMSSRRNDWFPILHMTGPLKLYWLSQSRKRPNSMLLPDTRRLPNNKPALNHTAHIGSAIL